MQRISIPASLLKPKKLRVSDATRPTLTGRMSVKGKQSTDGQIEPIKETGGAISLTTMEAERNNREIQHQLDNIGKTLSKYDVLFHEAIEEYGIGKRTELRNQPNLASKKMKILLELAEWINLIHLNVDDNQIEMDETAIAHSSDRVTEFADISERHLRLIENLSKINASRETDELTELNVYKDEAKADLAKLFANVTRKENHFLDDDEVEIDFDELYPFAADIEEKKRQEKMAQLMDEQRRKKIKEIRACKAQVDQAVDDAQTAKTRFKLLQNIISHMIEEETMKAINSQVEAESEEYANLEKERKRLEKQKKKKGKDKKHKGDSDKKGRSSKHETAAADQNNQKENEEEFVLDEGEDEETSGAKDGNKHPSGKKGDHSQTRSKQVSAEDKSKADESKNATKHEMKSPRPEQTTAAAAVKQQQQLQQQQQQQPQKPVETMGVQADKQKQESTKELSDQQKKEELNQKTASHHRTKDGSQSDVSDISSTGRPSEVKAGRISSAKPHTEPQSDETRHSIVQAGDGLFEGASKEQDGRPIVKISERVSVQRSRSSSKFKGKEFSDLDFKRLSSKDNSMTAFDTSPAEESVSAETLPDLLTSDSILQNEVGDEFQQLIESGVGLRADTREPDDDHPIDGLMETRVKFTHEDSHDRHSESRVMSLSPIRLSHAAARHTVVLGGEAVAESRESAKLSQKTTKMFEYRKTLVGEHSDDLGRTVSKSLQQVRQSVYDPRIKAPTTPAGPENRRSSIVSEAGTLPETESFENLLLATHHVAISEGEVEHQPPKSQPEEQDESTFQNSWHSMSTNASLPTDVNGMSASAHLLRDRDQMTGSDDDVTSENMMSKAGLMRDTRAVGSYVPPMDSQRGPAFDFAGLRRGSVGARYHRRSLDPEEELREQKKLKFEWEIKKNQRLWEKYGLKLSQDVRDDLHPFQRPMFQGIGDICIQARDLKRLRVDVQEYAGLRIHEDGPCSQNRLFVPARLANLDESATPSTAGVPHPPPEAPRAPAKPRPPGTTDKRMVFKCSKDGTVLTRYLDVGFMKADKSAKKKITCGEMIGQLASIAVGAKKSSRVAMLRTAQESYW